MVGLNLVQLCISDSLNTVSNSQWVLNSHLLMSECIRVYSIKFKLPKGFLVGFKEKLAFCIELFFGV